MSLFEFSALTIDRWQQFRQRPRAFYSALLLVLLYVLSLTAGLIANPRPYVVRYNGAYYSPILHFYPETTFGGSFDAETDYRNSYFLDLMKTGDNFSISAPIHWDFESINANPELQHPSPPSRTNWLGTDNQGRDILARLLYGFRVTMNFSLALAVLESFIGMILGAMAGFFGGWVDLAIQRVLEIWSSIPLLYVLIFFFSLITPNLFLILAALALFGWMTPQSYVRIEFLKSRNLEYVKAAQALGVSPFRIIMRHILPNALTMLITRFPFAIAGATTALISLDYLGLGVPPPTPSLGELLSQATSNVSAWWIGAPTFIVLVLILVLITFIGETILDVFDPKRN